MLSIKILMRYFILFIPSSKPSIYLVHTAHVNLNWPHFRWPVATELVSTGLEGANFWKPLHCEKEKEGKLILAEGHLVSAVPYISLLNTRHTQGHGLTGEHYYPRFTDEVTKTQGRGRIRNSTPTTRLNSFQTSDLQSCKIINVCCLNL